MMVRGPIPPNEQCIANPEAALVIATGDAAIRQCAKVSGKGSKRQPPGRTDAAAKWNHRRAAEVEIQLFHGRGASRHLLPRGLALAAALV